MKKIENGEELNDSRLSEIDKSKEPDAQDEAQQPDKTAIEENAEEGEADAAKKPNDDVESESDADWTEIDVKLRLKEFKE